MKNRHINGFPAYQLDNKNLFQNEKIVFGLKESLILNQVLLLKLGDISKAASSLISST